jgi:hypothetical protein
VSTPRFWPSPRVLDAARLAEIDAAGQFADEHDVQARDQLALEAGGVGQGLEAIGRAQVGVDVHRLAQVQQAGFRAQVARGAGPLRAADRAHQHRVAGQGRVADLVGQGRAVGVVAGAAVDPLLDVQVGGQDLGHPAHLGADLGADPVAGQEQKRGHRKALLDGFRSVVGDVERRHAAVVDAQLGEAGAPGGHVRAGAVEGQGVLVDEVLEDPDQAGIERILAEGVVQAARLAPAALDLGPQVQVRTQVGQALGRDADRCRPG